MKIAWGWRIAAVGLSCAGVGVVVLCCLPWNVAPPDMPGEGRHREVDWTALLADAGKTGDALEIVYPWDETVFPPEIAEPTFRWRENHPDADAWLVKIEFADGKEPLQSVCSGPQWKPSPEQWQDIKTRSVTSPAKVTVLGVNRAAPEKLRSSATIRIQTSQDEVGAPLFYREVNLPFLTAVADPARHIRWRFGPISAREPPPIVLEKLPVCGNCHSFSRDGTTLAMEVDSGNQKGGYVVAPVTQEIVLDPTKLLDWNEYKRNDGQRTFGLLCQISPDGRYVAGTVKDRALAVYKPELMFSQLFFLVKGITAIYDRERKTYSSLPGADDPEYVQTNTAWSPDGKYIVFARSRSKAFETETMLKTKSLVVPQQEGEAFLKGGKTFLFDLYRVPFNDGKGGKAEPIPGASNNGMSNYFAKYSPDGKWIVFCKARSFMLLQPDSQLYIIPAAGGQARRLRCNTARMNSWHSWSPNGRWLVFSSKINGPYTQLFLTHIDQQGESSPPVELANFTAPNRAANIPEFVNASADAIRKIREQFMDDNSHVRAGIAFLEAGELDDAERMFRKALEINPRSSEAHTRLARVLIQVHKPEEALQHLNTAVEFDPKNADLHYVLGDTLAGLGRVPEAIAHFELAVELKPDNAEAHYYLGNILAGAGKGKKAIAHYEQAVRLDPKYAEAHNSLATALASDGRLPEAIAHYRQAVAAKPDFAKARDNLNIALADAEKAQATIQQCERALKLNPNAADSLGELGAALMTMGRSAEAILPLQRAVQLNPLDATAHGNLAWVLATKAPGQGGNPARAVSLAQRACQLTGNKSADCLDTLAVAHAAAGQFPEAVATAEKAHQLAAAAGQTALAKRIAGRLEFYRAGRAYDGSALPATKPDS